MSCVINLVGLKEQHMSSTHGMSVLSLAKHVHGIVGHVHWRNTLCIFIVSGSSNIYSITPTLSNIFKGPTHLGRKLFAHGLSI